MRVKRVCGVLACVGLLLQAQDVKEFEKHVTQFTLPNGLQFVVMERHDAPAVSFYTYVRAGSADDAAGRTGLAQLMGDALLNGTEAIGSKNWAEERKALDAVEEVYDQLETERNQGYRSAQKRADTLEAQVRIAIDAANRMAQPKAFATVVEENGGTKVSVSATPDGSECGYNLPSNRIELWFLMESQRLMRPAFREFYAARDKLVAERGRSSEGVQGLFQALAAAAFEAHPYRNPTFGWPGDVGRLRRTDARQFLDKYYVPSNVTIAIVGDVNPAEARKLADKYFAPWPAKPWAGPVRTQEPPQMGPKSVVLEARPVMGRPIPTAMALVGYKRPSQYDQDDAAFDILQIALGQGRTGVLSQELVTDKRVLQNLQIRATFPAGRYPNLFVFALVPAQGRTVEDAQKSLEEFLNRLKSQKIQATIIERAKALAHVAAINRLTGNAGIAGMLGVYQANYGDWRKLFTAIDDFEKVTADDLQRVMVKYFVPAGRTTAYTVMAGLPVVAPGGGDQ